MKSTRVLIVLAAAVLAFVTIGSAKDPAVVSTWAASPLQIDGGIVDWQGDAFHFYKKFGVDYGFRNDANYFYVLFKFKDPQYMSSIRMTGMTIYVSGPEKKKKDYMIRFIQKSMTAEEYIALMEERRGPVSEEDKAKIRANEVYLNYAAEVTNKKAAKDAVSPPDAPGATYRMGKMEDGMVFEFAIPMLRAGDLAPGLGSAPGRDIKIGFEWGGMTKEMRDQRMKQVVSGSARASSGGGGSFNPRSENSGRTGESASIANMRRRSPKKYSFWVDVKLADQQ